MTKEREGQTPQDLTFFHDAISVWDKEALPARGHGTLLPKVSLGSVPLWTQEPAQVHMASALPPDLP